LAKYARDFPKLTNIPSIILPIFNLKTAVEYIPANKNQHKLDKVNWVM
jgi:hypothetical protein